MYRMGKASRLLGVFVLTVKKWIYVRKIKELKTAGGKH
ncbi:MAG: hypothetical protein BAJALOKI1v1_1390010 [Promethearchaeota archaeon]|nr:MAG: hypothetical protein BAJALOKI1v1_1390010 [Candidatus Lokiarchaeota archaeon]